jgi:hypothetical protein
MSREFGIRPLTVLAGTKSTVNLAAPSLWGSPYPFQAILSVTEIMVTITPTWYDNNSPLIRRGPKNYSLA